VEFSLTLLEEKQLCWFCHVKRMSGTRMSGHEEFKFIGKRPIGQPMIWWVSQVLEDRNKLTRKQEGRIVDRRDWDLSSIGLHKLETVEEEGEGEYRNTWSHLLRRCNLLHFCRRRAFMIFGVFVGDNMCTPTYLEVDVADWEG
jgi:hypothetical protein